jgi:FkbM family methyltransferase
LRKIERFRWFLSLEGVTFKDNLVLFFSKLFFAFRAIILYHSISGAKVEKLIERLYLPRPLTVKTRYGFLAQVTRFLEYVLFTRDFEPEIMRRLQVQNGIMTFIDVGANYGFYSLYTASKSPNSTIIAIEPFDKVFEALATNIKINNYQNIKCLNCAAWNKDNTTINLYLNRDSISNPSAVSGGENFVPVSARTIDSIISENLISKVDWLKIDVESAEVFVLQGAKKTLQITNNVLLEVHTKENGLACEKMLKDAGFKIEIIRQTKAGIYNLHAFK